MASALDVYTFFLEAADLRGQSHTVTVDEVTKQEIWDPRMKRKQPSLVLRFEKAKKVMKLNKTQCQSMIDIAHTDDYEAWPGMKIILTPGASFNGKSTIVITGAPAESKGLEQ